MIYPKLLFMILLLLIGTFTQGLGQEKEPKKEEEKEKNWFLTGYVKNLQSIVFFDNPGLISPLNDNLIHQRLNYKHFIGDHWQIKAGLRTRLFLGESVKLNPNYGPDINATGNDVFDLSGVWLDRPGVVGHSIIDRAYVEYSKGDYEVKVGRQRINWGISSIWNPNDLFNAFAFTDFDYEERPGSDAILVRKYTGYASSIELAFKLTADPEKSVVGLLWKFNKGSYDIQILGAYHKEDLVLGGGWAGNIGNGSFKGETSYFYSLDEDRENALALTLGYEYQFENSLFLSVGYLYNGAGQKSGNILELFSFELSARNLYPYRHSLVVSSSFPLNPLINGGLSIIYSPNENHPLFFTPNLSLSMAEDWDLSLVGQLVFAKAQNYNSPLQATYLRVKYSF